MSFVKLSSKGQITIPVKIRTILGVEAKDKLELLVRNNEVVIQPVKSFKSFRGSVASQEGEAKIIMEDAVAKHVLEEG
jgi:AbrB family looped-hinge helix DNA binding protein